MSDRVSDGLLAELRRKMDDGTPRGMVWPILADMFVACAEFASTPEEVTEANEVLAALLLDADDRAMNQLEMQMAIAQLQAYLDRNRAEESPDA